MMNLRNFILCSLLAVGCFASEAYAQSESQADPGRIDERIQRPDEPRLAPSVQVPARPPATLAPEGAEDVEFTLRRLEFDGLNEFSRDDLARQINPLMNKQITLADIFELAREITLFYRQQGFVFSRAIVPVQEIDDGVASIRIIEARIGR